MEGFRGTRKSPIVAHDRDVTHTETKGPQKAGQEQRNRLLSREGRRVLGWRLSSSVQTEDRLVPGELGGPRAEAASTGQVCVQWGRGRALSTWWPGVLDAVGEQEMSLLPAGESQARQSA